MSFRLLISSLAFSLMSPGAFGGSFSVTESGSRVIDNLGSSVYQVTISAYSLPSDDHSLIERLQLRRAQLEEFLESKESGYVGSGWSGRGGHKLMRIRIPAVEPSPVMPVYYVYRPVTIHTPELERSELSRMLESMNNSMAKKTMVSFWGMTYTQSDLSPLLDEFKPYEIEASTPIRSVGDLDELTRPTYLKAQSRLADDLSDLLVEKCQENSKALSLEIGCDIDNADFVIKDKLSPVQIGPEERHRIDVSVTATWGY